MLLYVLSIFSAVGVIGLGVGFGVWAGTRVNSDLNTADEKIAMLMDQVGILISAEPSGIVTVWRGGSSGLPPPIVGSGIEDYDLAETNPQPWAEVGVPSSEYLRVNTTGEYEAGIFFAGLLTPPDATGAFAMSINVLIEDDTQSLVQQFNHIAPFAPSIRSDMFIVNFQVTDVRLIRWQIVNNNAATTLTPLGASFWVTRLADLPTP